MNSRSLVINLPKFNITHILLPRLTFLKLESFCIQSIDIHPVHRSTSYILSRNGIGHIKGESHIVNRPFDLPGIVLHNIGQEPLRVKQSTHPMTYHSTLISPHLEIICTFRQVVHPRSKIFLSWVGKFLPPGRQLAKYEILLESF